MALTVQKYGGTSLQSPERIRAVAQRIAQARAQQSGLVVVVSAMGHTTDELIELAHQVASDPPRREMDMLLTAGERISMALLSMALADLRIPAVSLTGSQTGIVTNSSHRRARIQRILGDRVHRALEEGQVVIVAGFQGVSEKKEITTLGRGGSDTTAVALAAALKADLCEIYTDVDGVYSADPRIVPSARLWRSIPHDLMVEMAVRGAGVLHPRCVELARRFGVPLRVRNSLNDHEGTTIMTEISKAGSSEGMEDFAITAVTADRGKFRISLELSRPGAWSAFWDLTRDTGLSLVGVAFVGTAIQFFAEREAEAEWKNILEMMSTQDWVREYRFNLDEVPLSIVGTRFSQDASVMQEVTAILAKRGVEVTMGTASALGMTFAVLLSQVDEGVRALHEAFLVGRSKTA